MSGLAAVIGFDSGGNPLQPLETLHIVLRAAPHRAPDGLATWHDPSAALGLSRHFLFDGCPVAPVTRGSYALVFDGRLDGHADLLARLPEESRAFGRGGDAPLALAALMEWGEEAAGRLEGDYAFVLWNARDRRVIAGRDRLGMRPLHWTVDRSRLLLSSDVAQLVAVRGVPAPDESAVADLLGGEPPPDDRTLFRDIRRVPAGHLLVADARGAALRRYWAPEPAPSGARRADEDWAAECRTLVDRAVRVRMRARGPAAVFFSGGVDSSIVLTAASAVARTDGLPQPVAVALAFDDQPDSDESDYRDAVSRHLGLKGISVAAASMDATIFRAQAARRLALPDLPADLAGRPLRFAAQAAGASVALTGVGPDSLFSGSTFHYADLLSRGRVLGAARRYFLDRVTECSGWTPGAFMTGGLWPLLSARQRSVLRRPARRLAGISAERAWLRLPRAEPPVVPDPPPGVSYSTWEITWALRDGWTSYFLESAERTASEAGFEDRHPFMDASIVRFALSLPEDQRRRGRITKFVLRRAVPELAPAVAGRTSKADFAHLLATAMARLGGVPFFRALAIGEAGWVDPIALAGRYDRATRTPMDDPRTGRDLPMLWMVAATELWYRAAYTRSEGAMAV